MSAIQSDLSSLGYDMVVAVTQNAINSTMMEYLSSANIPAYTMCYNAGTGSNPPVQVSLDQVLAETGNVNPFNVPSWDGTGKEPADITALFSKKSNFICGFSVTIGIPTGYNPPNANPVVQPVVPPIVTINPGAQTVTFNLLCSNFQVVNAVFGDRGLAAYSNDTQQPGAAWIFQSTIPLQSILSNNGLTTKMSQALSNFTNGAFTVQQLLFDFDQAMLKNAPTLTNVPANSPLATLLTQVFVNTYFSAMSAGSKPILGFSLVKNANAQTTASLPITSMNFLASAYSPASAATAGLNTFNYLCDTGTDVLPTNLPTFGWNWIETTDNASFDGVVAINRNVFAQFMKDQLMQIAMRNCYLAYVKFTINYNEVDIPTSVTTAWSLTPNQTPTITMPTSGAEIISMTYTSTNGDQSGTNGWIASMTLTPTYTMTVSVTGSTMTIMQNLTIWAAMSSMGDDTSGNVVNTTITDVYTLSVNAEGQIVATNNPQLPNPNNQAQNLDISSLSNFFNGLNSLVDAVQAYAQNVANTALTDVPLSVLQSFVFPGGNAFSFADVAFSENQDLVSHIIYTTPS